jgi:hypothetical protein
MGVESGSGIHAKRCKAVATPTPSVVRAGSRRFFSERAGKIEKGLAIACGSAYLEYRRGTEPPKSEATEV